MRLSRSMATSGRGSTPPWRSVKVSPCSARASRACSPGPKPPPRGLGAAVVLIELEVADHGPPPGAGRLGEVLWGPRDADLGPPSVF